MTGDAKDSDLEARLAWRPAVPPGARRLLRAAGILLLIGGALWSWMEIGLDPARLSPGLIALNLVVLSPLNLLVAATTLRITARALGRDVGSAEALRVVAAANVAELLPLPGGAMVRGAALVKAGAGVVESARIVTLTAMLTLAMSVAVSAAALALFGVRVGLWLALLGAALSIGLLVLFARTMTKAVLAAMIAVRLATIALSIVRLSVSFAIFGAGIGLAEAAIYTAATSLGSAVAIVPAGFGVNEAIAAGLATLIAASPAAAFLSVALNRALGLLAGAAIVLCVSLTRRRAAH
jgi:uncharacterized membrane protein YbhN (UPF0104 family)